MLRHRLIILSACVFALALPLPARAQSDSYFGPQIGVFFPTDQDLKTGLGNEWFSFGASKLRAFRINQRNWAHDWNIIGQSRNGNTVFIVTGSLGYVVPFSEPEADAQPYAALRAGLAYIDYAVDTIPAGRKSGKVIAGNGNAALGINFSERYNIEVRYDVWNSYDGLSFNGWTIALRAGLFRF